MNNNKITSVKAGFVGFDPTVEGIFKYAINPKFFNSAVKHYNYYAIPPAYEKNGRYYALAFPSSIKAILENKDEEILINLIEFNEANILDFLLAFQYQEHKEERCMAELIKVCQEYVLTATGKKWLKKNTSNEDKEEQYAELFGISSYTAKCYFKVLQPHNKKYLDKLAKNYSLHNAYMDCLKAEKGAKPAGEKPANGDGAPTNEEQQSDTAEQPVSIGNSGIRRARAEEPEPILSDDDLQKHFEDHNVKANSKHDESEPEQEFALKVLVLLRDGTQLELAGKIDLVVDGTSIRSTEQLTKNPDGTWRLPEHHSPVSLMVYAEDDVYPDL